MLMTRLRKSDIIGRYGGEEFVVLMPDTGEADALKVLNGLRGQFEKIRYLSGGQEFSCTFSAGVGTAPPFVSVDLLIQQTDHAMYQAKQSGRNKVCVASTEARVKFAGGER